MKILFVHELFGAASGAEANLHLTAREMRLRGHSVGILHGDVTGRDLSSWQETFGFRFDAAQAEPDRTTTLALRQFAPDLIYVHKMADLRVLRELVGSRIPIVRMVHDHEMYCLRGYRYHPVTRAVCERPASWRCVCPCGGVVKRSREPGRRFEWASYADKQQELALNRCFDRMLVATAFMKRELLRNGFEESRISVHPPVTHPARDEETASFGENNRIIYAGQVIRGKGVDLLLQALSEIRVPYECVIVGEGSHRGECESLCHRLGLSDRVSFKGFVPQQQLKTFYRESSVAVLSSVWPEPFGAAGLEAMLFGLPVAAFNVGGVSEWLVDGFNGRLVPEKDTSALASAIESLLANKALAREMGERGRRYARARFDVPRYVSRLEQTLERVLAGDGARSNR